MSNFLIKLGVVVSLFLFVNASIGQSLTHPCIWIKDSEKAEMLSKIENVAWAKKLFNEYKSRTDSKKASHKINPATIINTIPNLPGSRTTHRNTMTLGYDAALLYWLTGDDDYGQLAADILYNYVKKIAAISGDIRFNSDNNDYLIETREDYTKPPMIYDFVYSFLKKSGTKVYDKDTGTKVDFNFTKAQTAFKKMADNVLTRGGMNSNHPVLEAPGLLFNVLCIDDDATRNTYFNKFMNGTNRQNGLNWMIKEIKDHELWPESTGYSIGPHRITLQLMEIADRYKPSLDLFENNKELLEKVFVYENYRFPDNNSVMRFGDAHRTRLNTQALCERVLKIADRKNYATIKKNAEDVLKAIYKSKSSGFSPSVETQTLEWNNPLYLLWAVDVDYTNAIPFDYSTAISVDYSGLAMQRNINTSDVKESGLMGYTGGAHYVHSHLSGLDMELYGLGAVLGTGGGDVGAADRAQTEFRNYHRIYAGHNTVIVNGTSKGGGEGSWKSDNQLFMNKTVTVAAEPKSFIDPVASEFSFSAQELDDKINNAMQQRVFSVIRTSDNTGYYFDLFRSKSLGENKFHDYVYHNIGDNANLVDNNNAPLALTPKTDRYQSVATVFNNKTIMFPGWHYFEEVKTSDKTTAGVKATIPSTKQGTRYMHMLMPGGEEREYTACKGPAIIEAQLGYEGQKTPIVTVRHHGEAWTKPFISVFEPSRNQQGSVVSIENLYSGTEIVGAKVTSSVGGKTIIDYIISNQNGTATYTSTSPAITFTGRFAIVRVVENTAKTYIGEGETLTYEGFTLNADAGKKGYKEFDLNSTPDRIVAYNANGGVAGTITQEIVEDGSTPALTGNPQKQGHTLAGWKTADGAAFDASTVITDNIEVFAQWQINQFSMNTASTNGSVSKSPEATLYDYMSEVVLTATPDNGYVFAGWTGDTQSSQAIITVTMDAEKSLTANFDVVVIDEPIDEPVDEVSIKHNDLLSVTISPNPSNGVFRIKVSDNNDATYKLYNICGQIIQSGAFNSETTIHVTNNSKGVYLLQVVSGNARTIQKVVISK